MISLYMVGECHETDVRVNIWYLLLQLFGEGIQIQKSFFFFFPIPFSVLTGYVLSVHQEEGNLKSLGLDGCRIYV